MSRTNKFLNSQDDINWLMETHLKDEEEIEQLKLSTKSFILVGNEDSPTLIECYNRKDPNFGEEPFFVWKDNEITIPSERVE